jgi:hypothetical protein
MTKITYVPQDEDDKNVCEMWGDPERRIPPIRFLANVPVEVDDARSVEVEESKRSIADDGSFRLVPIRKRIPIKVLAEGNPQFHVEGGAPKKRGPGRPRKALTAGEELGVDVPVGDLDKYEQSLDPSDDNYSPEAA